MRQVALGFVLFSVLVAALAVHGFSGPGNTAGYQTAGKSASKHARAVPASDALITLSLEGDGKHHQLVLIDPTRQAMGVYHVDPASGAVALKAVRQFHWDLQLRGFNEVRPLAEEIRAMADQR